MGTIDRSTSAAYLAQRGIGFRGYNDLQTMLADFEADELDAVIFDGPILAYYVRIKSDGNVLVADTRKIEFYNTSQYIHANSTNDLTLASGDDINYQSNYNRFFHAGVEGARISTTTASWVARNVSYKYIIFINCLRTLFTSSRK